MRNGIIDLRCYILDKERSFADSALNIKIVTRCREEVNVERKILLLKHDS